jgi:hypothetical protein
MQTQTFYREAVKFKLSLINSRLAELADVPHLDAMRDVKGQVPGPQRHLDTDKNRERNVERRELLNAKRECEALLPGCIGNPLTGSQRDNLNRNVSESVEQTRAFADKLEQGGDHRQAKIHRLHLLDVYERCLMVMLPTEITWRQPAA